MNPNLLGEITQWIYPLCSVSILLLAVLRFRQAYWGKMLVVGASLQLAGSLFWRVTFVLRENLANEWFERLQPFVMTAGLLGEILIVLAISSAPLAPATAVATTATRGPTGEAKNPWLLLVLLPVTANIYWMFWLYRVVRELRQYAPDSLSFTPGKAVGFMFIPVFNLYWFFRVVGGVTANIGRLNRQLRARAGGPDSAYTGWIVTVLMLVALSLNSLGGAHFGFLLVGEAILISALFHTQRSLNAIWQSADATQPVAAAHAMAGR